MITVGEEKDSFLISFKISAQTQSVFESKCKILPDTNMVWVCHGNETSL